MQLKLCVVMAQETIFGEWMENKSIEVINVELGISIENCFRFYEFHNQSEYSQFF